MAFYGHQKITQMCCTDKDVFRARAKALSMEEQATRGPGAVTCSITSDQRQQLATYAGLRLDKDVEDGAYDGFNYELLRVVESWFVRIIDVARCPKEERGGPTC
jgi:hypothetical protein